MTARPILVFLLLVFLATTTSAGTIKGKVTFDGKPQKFAAVHLEGDIKSKVDPPRKRAVITQKNQLFIPQILPVFRGTTVDMPNKDIVFHSAFSLSPGNQFDLGTYKPGKTPNVQFASPGKVDIFCNMHEQMHAVVLVLEHPYFALTSKKGTYEIKGVPEGTYKIKAWVSPERFKEQTVTVGPSDSAISDFDVPLSKPL